MPTTGTEATLTPVSAVFKIRDHIDGPEFEKCPGCIDRMRLTGINHTPAPGVPPAGTLFIEATHGPIYVCYSTNNPSFAAFVVNGIGCTETFERLHQFAQEVTKRTEPLEWQGRISGDLEKIGYKESGEKFIRFRSTDEHNADYD